MKKGIIYLALLFSFFSCKEEYVAEFDVPMTEIYLNTPGDGVKLDFNDEGAAEYEFSWDKASEAGSVLIFSETEDLVTSHKIDAGTGTSYKMSPASLNAVCALFGIKAEEEGKLYWTVKHNDNMDAAASEVRLLHVKRMPTSLTFPEDLAKWELRGNKRDTVATFEWDATLTGDAPCQLYLSTDPEMNNAVAYSGTGTSKIGITHQEIQNMIEQIPFSRYKSNPVYWNIKNTATDTYVSKAPNLLNLTDMMIFVDRRGDEAIEYPVVRITYTDGTSLVWIAENLRTKLYPDGTEIGTENCLEYNGPNKNKFDDKLGYYYKAEIRDRIAPNGWRLPTKSEWMKLFDQAAKAGGYYFIKHQQYWVLPDPTGQEKFNKWGLGVYNAGVYSINGNFEDVTRNVHFSASDFGSPSEHRSLCMDDGPIIWESWAGATIMRFVYIE